MEKLFTIKEAAEILRLKPDTLYLKCAQGKLPHYQYDNKVIRISERHIKEYLERSQNRGVKIK